MLLVTVVFFPSHFSKPEQLRDLRMLFHPDRLCETFQNACCYLANSDLFSGCKKFKLMKLLRTTSRSRTFLFTTASRGRSSFVHFGLLRVAEQKFRHVGLCEMCIWRVRVPEGRAIYNRCVYFRAEDDERAFHLNTCFGGSKIATEDNVGRDQKWTGLYHIEIIPNLDRPPKQIFAIKKENQTCACWNRCFLDLQGDWGKGGRNGLCTLFYSLLLLDSTGEKTSVQKLRNFAQSKSHRKYPICAEAQAQILTLNPIN